MACWPVLVTLHNLVNVPLAACENGPRTFVVEAHMVHRVSAYSAPVAAATFTTDDVVSTTPNLFEVRLDEVSRGNNSDGGGGAKVWRCALPELEVAVLVREVGSRTRGGPAPSSSLSSSPPFRGDAGDGRVVGTSEPLRINVKDVVEVHKLATRIVGTEMGQVGLSFAVDPDDKAGYRQRLERFLRRHNPQGLRLVPNVVEVVSELDTFTKLYRRYAIQDYEARLAGFFDVYGPQYKGEIPSLLRQWEGREEELMRNLVLDNGPEVATIDPHQRLTAYLAAHQLDRTAAEVQEVLAVYAPDAAAEASAPADLFAALVERYGPEPDPRTYLFAPPHYTPAAVAGAAGTPGSGGSSPAAGSPHRQNTAGRPQRTPPTPVSDRAYLSVALSPTPQPQREAPQETARSLDRSPSFAVESAPAAAPSALRSAAHAGAKQTITPSDNVVVSDPSTGFARRGRDAAALDSASPSLWRKMCSMMQARQRQYRPWRPWQLFFLDSDGFTSAVQALHVFTEAPEGGEVQALAQEWRRRVDHALRIEVLSPSDAYFAASVQEAVRLVGLQPLHVQALSVSTLFHSEQYAGFSAYVEERAKRARTERLVLVGDARRLMEVARFGLHGGADPAGRQGITSSTSTPTATRREEQDSAAARDGPFRFLREPFRGCTDRRSCALLVCDVAVGAMFLCPSDVHVPREASAEFLSSYDSCAYEDAANGPAVAVYAREQVFPRLLVQCTVDPALLPCPAHPDRPVEYYVTDSHAFACSRCVVLGAYKGREVTPIEEAAVMARAGLADVARTTDALRESMRAYANQLRNEEDAMPSAPRHIEAEREIARLQQETEERIRRIRREVDLEDAAQLARIAAERTEVQATLHAADVLGDRLAAALQERAPAAAVTALQHIQQEGQVEQLMARAQERVPGAALELVLPLDAAPAAPALPPPRLPSTQGYSADAASSAAMAAGGVAGLNESRLPDSTGETIGGLTTTAKSSKPRRATPPPAATISTSSNAGHNSLYAQYLAVAGKAEGRQQPQSQQRGGAATVDIGAAASAARPHQQHLARQRNPPLPSLDHSTVTPVAVLTAHRRLPAAASFHSGEDGSDVEGEARAVSAKEALTRGWALLRRGDVAAAQRTWAAVCRAHGTDDVMGTKAHAYIAEAIEKDYAAAAQWYARSLQLDPQDRMTAYNYGVLLEALLDQPQEALRMYDRAAALGDGVAETRAREVRAALAASATPHR